MTIAAIRVERLDHVSLNVADRARSIAWYRDVLGVEPTGEATRDDWPVFLGRPGACIALFQAQAETPERAPESVGLRHVAFMVGRGELERATQRLRDRGVDHRLEDHGSSYSVYFSDPDGNVLELTTYEVG